MGYKLGVASITISTAFAIISSLVITGFHKSIETRIGNLLGSINIASNYSNKEHFDIRPLKSLKSTMPDDVIELKAVIHKHVLLQSEKELEGVTLYGLDNTVSHKNIEVYVTDGRLPNLKEQELDNEIAISQGLANKFNITVGSKLLMCALNNNAIYRKLVVVGIYNTHLPDFDNKFAFCGMRFAQKLNGWDSNTADSISCFLKKPRNNAKVAKYINTILKSSILHAKCIEEEYYDIFEWISVLYKNTIIFIVLLLIIVNTNLAAIIAMQVIDRLYMVRVLKSLGARAKQLIEIFIINNLSMVGKGVLYGNIIGISMCAVQSFTKGIKLNSSVHYIDHVPIDWQWSIIVAINLGTLVTTLAILILTNRIVYSKKVISEYL